MPSPGISSCQCHEAVYSNNSVKLNWKILPLTLCGAMLPLVTGCSGINASKSVSPATFLLPGLLQADPAPVNPEPVWPATLPVAETDQS
jgi:hypothetical protein